MTKTIEDRLRFLEDHFLLTQLLHDYQRFTDGADPENWARCWTEDAVVARADGSPMRGHQELAEGVAKSIAQFDTRQHVLTNPTFQIDGDRASGICGLIYTGRPTGAGIEEYTQFGGTYRWGFRRTSAGWKIETRELIIDWRRPTAA